MVAIRRWDPPNAVSLAEAEISKGMPAAAITRLEAALPSSSGEARLAVMDRLRVAHFAIGDGLAASRWVERMLAYDEAPTSLRTRARAASAAAYVHAYLNGDVARALPFVEPLEQLAPTHPEVAVWAAFSRGLVARQLGDPTRAHSAFYSAERQADRLGMLSDQIPAMEGLAITLGELSREEEALALSDRMLEVVRERPLDCKARALALNTLGWVQLLLAQAGLRHLAPESFLEDALDSFVPAGECPDHFQEINVRINLGLAELDRDDPAMALVWLEPVMDVPRDLADLLCADCVFQHAGTTDIDVQVDLEIA